MNSAVVHAGESPPNSTRDSAAQINVQRYRELCETDHSIPLFSQAWWLDLVAPGKWDVALNRKGAEISAALPYVQGRRFAWRISAMPPLTQTLGPWVAPTNEQASARFRHEMAQLTELAASLPSFHLFSQNWHYSLTNWLPFYWAGFQQTTRYTYRLEEIGDTAKTWSGLAGKTRTEIRKATQRHGLVVDPHPRVEDFIPLNAMVFDRQGIPKPYPDTLVAAIGAEAAKRNALDLVIVRDGDGAPHAGALVVRDHTTGYYLLGGSDPALRHSGGATLALWEAIMLASKQVNSFDFEGSMMKSIEPFVRNFGSTQTPYFQISRTTSRPLKVLTALRDAQ